MASTYLATALQDAIYTSKQSETFQSFETRGSVYGALDIAKVQTNLLLPASTLQKLKMADTQAEKINVFKKEAAGNGTAFSCTGSGHGSTARQTLTYEPFVETFEMSAGDMAANMYEYQEMFNSRWAEKMKNLYTRIDEYIVSILEGAYTQGEGDNFTVFNNAFQVPLNQYDLSEQRAAMWVNKLKADIRKNDFSGDNIHLLGDSNLVAVMSAQLNQGQGTATNLGFQFQGITSNFSNRVVNNEGIYATGYAFEKGAFGIIDWVDPLFRKGATNGQTEWASFVDNRYGFTWGVLRTKTCADNTSIFSGMTMGADLKETIQIGIQVAVPTAYSSDGNSFIYKYELNEDNTVSSGSGSY